MQWVYSYFTWQRGARIITRKEEPRRDEMT